MSSDLFIWENNLPSVLTKKGGVKSPPVLLSLLPNYQGGGFNRRRCNSK
jgi:hypothetical protein